VDVASSHGLSADEKKSIETRFSKILGNPVEATYLVDPKLVGGVKVTAAGKTYDGTISGWLGQFEEILVGGNV
jgi:F0F1-type ATP synthase delta subunit